MKIKEDGSDDFLLRTIDVIADAKHRQMQELEAKTLKDMASKLNAIKDERRTALDLLASQTKQYDEIHKEINASVTRISKIALLELPQDIRLHIENTERKIRNARNKAAAEKMTALEEEGILGEAEPE